ncbi:hypothetical protein HPB51_018568 [Rhipicephalus microplus]|uniref:Peptidase M13 N-terminal domain-containing protein n=1 Tax=Rhipicephalus microplus TaxID=6941 RepID=A0A9J6F834_RHIMP|nr:hypothetical protein HPB51_018568 [Rhipicephalus microplus]
MSRSPQSVKPSEGGASSWATAHLPGSSALRSPGNKSSRRTASPREATTPNQTPTRTPAMSGSRSPLGSHVAGTTTPAPAYDLAESTGALMAAFGAPGYITSSKKAASSDGAATSPKGQVQLKAPEVASKEALTTASTVAGEEAEANDATTATTAASLRVSQKPTSPSRQASAPPKLVPTVPDHYAASSGHCTPEDGSPKHPCGPSDKQSPKQEVTPSSPSPPRQFPFSTETLGCLVFLILAVIIAIVFATVYCLTESKNSTAAAIKAAPELANACADNDSHAGCHNVTLYMLNAINPDARPCADFYDSVCGWWRAKNPDRRPFLEEYVATFNHRVADTLVTKATFDSENSSSAQSLDTQMALFYASCFRATTGQSETSDASAVFEATGSDVSAWMNVSSFTELLDLAVSTTLRSGLPSFVRVEYWANRTFRLGIGQSLASTFARDFHKARMFVARTLYDLGIQSSAAWPNSSTLFAIDLVVDNEQSKGDGKMSPPLKSPNDLAYIATEIDWEDSLERGLPSRFSSNAQSEMTVLIRAADEIRSIVCHLRKLPLRHASMYSLVVLLAQRFDVVLPVPVAEVCTEALVMFVDVVGAVSSASGGNPLIRRLVRCTGVLTGTGLVSRLPGGVCSIRETTQHFHQLSR